MNLFKFVIKAFINALMTLIIITGITFVVLYLIGMELFVVQSGSMEPEIPTYCLVLVNKKVNYDDIKENDIIAYQSQAGSKVIHRAINISQEGIETKGDANNASDGISVTRSNLLGKYVYCVPKAGYFVKSLQSRKGKIILVTIACVFVVAGFLFDDEEEKQKKKEEKLKKNEVNQIENQQVEK